VVSALLVPVIAGVTAYIALQQYKNNKNQFRLALMERRSKVFNATGELNWLSRNGQIDWSHAVVDSCSVRAVFGGRKLGRIRPIELNGAASTI